MKTLCSASSALVVSILCASLLLVAGYAREGGPNNIPETTNGPTLLPSNGNISLTESDKNVGTCTDKCNARGHDPSSLCQCNEKCREHGDCCPDYGVECLSCDGRCHFTYDKDLPCQCNSKCAKFKNCCEDHSKICRRGSSSSSESSGSNQGPNPTQDQNQSQGKPPRKTPVTDNELAQISETIFGLEGPNNAAASVRVNLGNRTYFNSSVDRSFTPLLQVQTNALRKPTIAKLLTLHNNYVPAASTPEVVTSAETTEETQFLDEILATPIMRKTEDFLVNKGFILRQRREGGRLRNFPRAFRDALQQIWFGLYSREAGAMGSSGFEHIFLGETKNNEVSGFHNWVFFSQEESKNNLNYYGHIRSLSLGSKGSIIKHNFQWMGARKPIATMFIGTSPELEIALYTICFYSRPGQRCPVVLGGKNINIQTHFISRQGKRFVGSSYPDI